MASQTGTPANTSNETSVGSHAWSLASVEDNDGLECSATIASGTQTHYLQAIDCGLAIPSDATIDGILVSVLRRSSNAAGGSYPSINDVVVKLTHSGTILGTNKADTVTDWPASELEADYGGAADTWGAGLAASQINHESFGVMISVDATGGALPATAYIDRVVITVYYTEAEPPPLPPPGSEHTHYDEPDEPEWMADVSIGIVDDDLNLPPTADAVTLLAPTYDQHDDPEERDWFDAAFDVAASSMTDGLADAMYAMAERHEDCEDYDRSGYEFAGAAWLADGSICDCGGIAVVVRSGYGTAAVKSYESAAGESQAFGTATILGGYGTAKIIISCQC